MVRFFMIESKKLSTFETVESHGKELTQQISNDTMEKLQDIDMLDFYMTVVYV